MVAMLGSIMPAPLAMPTRLPWPTLARRTLGYRSVVMMDRAASRRLRWPTEVDAVGTAANVASMGRRQPMTPVELGKIWLAAMPSALATPAHRRGAVVTPSGAHTFEILLLTTMAPRDGSSRRRRPTMTGAPGKALRVKTAAKSAVGLSSTMRVRFMAAGLGTSTGTNSKRAVPTRKPAGRMAWVESQAWCASREAKVNVVLAMAGT